MLHEFIEDNHEELLSRARRRVGERRAPRATRLEIDRGVPKFLTQLSDLLKHSLTAPAEDVARKVMDESAETHGRDALLAGLSIGQVVHDYGDVCQAVTELAVERQVTISANEFRAFNRCLDDAIAQAVTSYSDVREHALANEGAERLGTLAHELRNVLASAMLSWDSIKRGVAGTGGSTAEMHTRSLVRLRDIVDRSLTQVRLDAEHLNRELVVVAEFIEEEEIAGMIEAKARGLEFSVAPVDPELVVEVDRQVLASALSNLLVNAFKFTRPQTMVTLAATGTKTRVYIGVEDECGGLPPGAEDALFQPFGQHSADRTGLGLGLVIARRAVEANGGELRVHNRPHMGCRFTIDLPRHGSQG